MRNADKTPDLALTEAPAAELDADLIVIPCFVDDDLADEPTLDQAAGGEVGRARARAEFVGKLHETLFVPTLLAGWKTPRAVLVGGGPRSELTADHLRRLATVGCLAARQRRVPRVAILHRAGTPVPPLAAAQAVAEGAVLANYDGASWKTNGPPPVFLDRVEIRIGSAPPGTAAAIACGRALGECTNQARAMSNAPGNELTPRVFAERATALAAASGLAVEVLDERQIAVLRMGLLLGVARGSQEPPRLVVLRHEPQTASKAVLGLVGKGITFDTGGISIKPADNMDKMKDDMSGGAAVICAMSAIARLNLPVRCIGIVPMTENMPGGRAIKPGDVLTSATGRTVEIINTDAEGRLVLGDALWYARERGATHLGRCTRRPRAGNASRCARSRRPAPRRARRRVSPGPPRRSACRSVRARRTPRCRPPAGGPRSSAVGPAPPPPARCDTTRHPASPPPNARPPWRRPRADR
jgi:leucyl aminopeptidase